ncbi:MAG: ABC transporter substrate-binding protein [candidate division WOR-3 bacterium]|nr:ABC transporter substrate-binding protein [candidate division WOR-3 bacterium]
MTKLLNAIIAILTLVLIFIIVYPQWQESRPVTVRIGCDSTVSSVVFAVTQEKNFFKNERIIPEFVYYSDPNLMLNDLTLAKIHCAIVPWPTLLKYVPITSDSFKVLSSVEFRVSIPIDAIFINPVNKTKIKDLKGLKNKRFGYPPQVRELIPVVLKQLGIKETEIKLIEMPNSALVSALSQNQLDAILVLEPERTSALNQGLVALVEAVLPKNIVAPFPGSAYTITAKLIKNQKRIATKLKVLLDATVAFVDANVEDSRKMFLKFYNLDPNRYQNVYLPQFQKLVEINKGAVITLMSRMVEAGVLMNSFDIQPLFPEPAQFKQ